MKQSQSSSIAESAANPRQKKLVRIDSPEDHVRVIIEEVALYLQFRQALQDGNQVEGKRKSWEAHKRRRIQLEEEAIDRGTSLPWHDRLTEAQLNEDSKNVLNLLLALAVSPTCLDYFQNFFCDQDASKRLISTSKVMQLAHPYLCSNEISLFGCLAPNGLLGQKGFLIDCSFYYENRLVRCIALDDSIILDALGYQRPKIIGECLVRREYPTVSLDSVVLPESVKEKVLKLVESCLTDQSLFDPAQPGARGVSLLFYGPAGTGKTLLARAIASHFKLPLLCFKAEAVGFSRIDNEEALPALFRRGKQENAIVFIDEVDDVFLEGSGASRALLLSLEDSDCVTIMATNNVENLDPALERRFTARIRFRLPDEQARKQLWRVLKPARAEYAADVSLNELSRKYAFSGAQIANCLANAARQATRKPDDVIEISSDLLRQCAEEQLSTFMATGYVENWGRPDAASISEVARFLDPSIVVDDVEWIRSFRKEKANLSRFFPARADRGPILLLLHGTEVVFESYAKALAAMLSFRLVSSRISDLLTLLSRENKKTFSFAEGNPCKFLFTRLVNEESVLLIEDDLGEVMNILGSNNEPVVTPLFAAMQKSSAVVLIARNHSGELSPSIFQTVDRIKSLEKQANNHAKTCWDLLRERGYPLSIEAGEPQTIIPNHGDNSCLDIAALDAYLLDTRERKKKSVISVQDIQERSCKLNHILNGDTPHLFSQVRKVL